MTNEQRAEKIIAKYGFDFEKIPKEEIIALIEAELDDFQEGSSEYIRLLCGYLYCIGDQSDVPLINQVKYGINMDVGCMVDLEWIESLEHDGAEMDDVRSKEELIEDFKHYYRNFEADDLCALEIY